MTTSLVAAADIGVIAFPPGQARAFRSSPATTLKAQPAQTAPVQSVAALPRRTRWQLGLGGVQRIGTLSFHYVAASATDLDA
jgi:hypothetical protein